LVWTFSLRFSDPLQDLNTRVANRFDFRKVSHEQFCSLLILTEKDNVRNAPLGIHGLIILIWERGGTDHNDDTVCINL